MSLLEIKNLCSYYKVKNDLYNQAVDNVSFTLREGEIFGLIGESGCGKSTLGYSIINSLSSPGEIVDGNVYYNGQDIISLPEGRLLDFLWSEVAMIPQSAMNALNPSYKVGDQIVEAILRHNRGTSKREAVMKAESLLKMVGIDDKWYHAYPHKLSGGMKQRIIIAMALSCEPKILICDEATTGLDVLIQAQILALLKKLKDEEGMSIIVISHDLLMVTSLCDRIGIMYAGNMVEVGTTEDILVRALHPYTKALFKSQVSPDNFAAKVNPIKGIVPKLINPLDQCRFYSRCDKRVEQCKKTAPELINISGTHSVACYLMQDCGEEK